LRVLLILQLGFVGLIPACTLPPVREPGDRPLRTVQLSRELALAAMTAEMEITEYRGGQVAGRFWATSGDVNRQTLENLYACAPTADTTQSGIWACRPTRVLIDWRKVLAALDRAGVMAPPVDDTPRSSLCSDGAPWRLVVHGDALRESVATAQGCGPVSPARVGFERQIDSIMTSVDRQAQRQP
jgi:hypothetical protein